jgi:hypothetical protein
MEVEGETCEVEREKRPKQLVSVKTAEELAELRRRARRAIENPSIEVPKLSLETMMDRLNSIA